MKWTSTPSISVTNWGSAFRRASTRPKSYSSDQYRVSAWRAPSWTPCDRSATRSLLGQRVAAMRLRRSSTFSSLSTWKGRMSADASMAVLLSSVAPAEREMAPRTQADVLTPPLRRPAEAGGLRAWRQRARRQAARGVVLVVRARRHVVRRIGVEKRGEQFDLPATHAQLAHATAIHRSPLPRAACVDVEQPAQRTDARRLDVHDARRQRRRADVLGVADRRVVRHAIELIGEPLLDLGQVVRVLQVGVRERGEHVVVQRGQRLRILDLEAVLTLEVDRVHRSGGRDLLDERRPPGRLPVELESDTGRAGEPAADGLDRRLLAEAERVDEPHRLGRQVEDVV